MSKQKVWQRTNPERTHIWVTKEVKEIVKKKMEKDPNFNFSEYVRGLIVKDTQLEECPNCGDKVKMVSEGWFCPHCYC